MKTPHLLASIAVAATAVAADFKDPSDQTPTGERTVTYAVRAGVTYFFGGQAKNGPCLNAKPMNRSANKMY